MRRSRRTTSRLKSRFSARSCCRRMPPTWRSSGSSRRTSTSRPISRSSRRSPALFDGNQPIDAITVSDALRRTEQLDRVGGVEYLTALLDRVPTTSNVDYYADIVDETAARRRLMKAGSEVSQLAMQTDREIADVHRPGRVQRCLRWPSARSATAWSRSGPMLKQTLERIEELGTKGAERHRATHRLHAISTGCWPACSRPISSWCRRPPVDGQVGAGAQHRRERGGRRATPWPSSRWR